MSWAEVFDIEKTINNVLRMNFVVVKIWFVWIVVELEGTIYEITNVKKASSFDEAFN